VTAPHGGDDGGEPVDGTTCGWCGTPADGPQPPLGWVTSVEAGAQRIFCPACSREHLRAIEGKLDPAWW
jgi:hypothetical protein